MENRRWDLSDAYSPEIYWTLLTLQKTDTYINSVDPAETAYKPSHQNLYCSLFDFDFWRFRCNNGYVQIQLEEATSEMQEWKGL